MRTDRTMKNEDFESFSVCQASAVTVPFSNAEEAWFWFILAQQAKEEGARLVAGFSSSLRPCEPVDILNILNGLYRHRRLLMDHLLVLRHYGRRQLSPDPRRPKEARASVLWHEALSRLENIFIRKGIVGGAQSGPEDLFFPLEDRSINDAKTKGEKR